MMVFNVLVFNLNVVNTYALSYERRKFTISHYCNRKILNSNLSFFYDRYIIHRREKNNTEKLRNSGVTSNE